MGKNFTKSLYLSIFLCAALSSTIDAQAFENFPYSQTFTSGVQPAEITLLNPQNGTNANPFNTNGMQLNPCHSKTIWDGIC